MASEVDFQIPQQISPRVRLKEKPIEFSIRVDRRTIGTIELYGDKFVWFHPSARVGIEFSWEELAELLEKNDTGKKFERRGQS